MSYCGLPIADLIMTMKDGIILRVFLTVDKAKVSTVFELYSNRYLTQLGSPKEKLIS